MSFCTTERKTATPRHERGSTIEGAPWVRPETHGEALIEVVPAPKYEDVTMTWDWACNAMLGACVAVNEILGDTPAGEGTDRRPYQTLTIAPEDRVSRQASSPLRFRISWSPGPFTGRDAPGLPLLIGTTAARHQEHPKNSETRHART